MESLMKMLKGLASQFFYGEIVIKFEAGKIVNVRKNESMDVKVFQ